MTNWASDDLAQIAAAPHQEFAGLAEGIIRAWNPATFESVIDVGGADLPNLPVASGVEALTYVSGDVVILSKWRPHSKRGIATYRIGMGGRVITPGSGAAAKAVAFMTSALAKNLSAEVFAERIHDDTVDTSEGTGSSTYTDLATAGPTVAGVEIATGKALVLISGRIRSEQSGSGNSESFMSFAVSGASTLAADDSRAASTWVRLSVHPTESHIVDIAMRGTAQVWLTGLNNGVHTFTAKYRTTGAASNFGVRAMTVITF
jgi:hypothetical protein